MRHKAPGLLMGSSILLFVLITSLIAAPVAAQSTRQTRQSDDPSIQQMGTWTVVSHTSAQRGSYLVNGGSATDTLTVAFSGTYLEIVYVAAPTLGTLVVEIDGTPRRTVDTRSDNLLFDQRIVFDYLDDNEHIATIYGVEGASIGVDAFITESASMVTEAVGRSTSRATPALLVTDNTTQLNESTPATTTSYELNLAMAPVSGNVVVDISTDGQCAVNPTQLTFSAVGAQTVTVSAVNDGVDDGAVTPVSSPTR